MSKTILFHCGSAKTGSTTLQKELWAAQTALRSAGFYYCPRFVRRGDVDPLNQAIRQLRSKQMLAKELERGVTMGRRRLQELFAMEGVHTVILSNESALGDPFHDGRAGFFPLFDRSMEGLQRIFAGYTVKAFFTVRNQAELLPSFYTQRMRQGGSYSPQAYYDWGLSFDLSWVPVVRRLQAAFPELNLQRHEVLTRQAVLAAATFREHLPDSVLQSMMPIGKINSSASVGALWVMRRFNALAQQPRMSAALRVRAPLFRFLERSVPGRKAALPANYQAQLQQLYQQDLQALGC